MTVLRTSSKLFGHWSVCILWKSSQNLYQSAPQQPLFSMPRRRHVFLLLHHRTNVHIMLGIFRTFASFAYAEAVTRRNHSPPTTAPSRFHQGFWSFMRLWSLFRVLYWQTDSLQIHGISLQNCKGNGERFHTAGRPAQRANSWKPTDEHPTDDSHPHRNTETRASQQDTNHFVMDTIVMRKSTDGLVLMLAAGGCLGDEARDWAMQIVRESRNRVWYV